ncbi:50S ribosomal protein L37e [Candidatus Micrarchaeota archaeon RBG_16_36_9]|nr:MAG: 50S ribosomal protein L37e [Candidatus Micrarchaeota archaeon RBG_16_36_9]
MVKGTPSFGRHRKVTHARCRRCGSYSYHLNKRKCSRCGYPSKKLADYNWKWKHPLKRHRKK